MPSWGAELPFSCKFEMNFGAVNTVLTLDVSVQ